MKVLWIPHFNKRHLTQQRAAMVLRAYCGNGPARVDLKSRVQRSVLYTLSEIVDTLELRLERKTT